MSDKGKLSLTARRRELLLARDGNICSYCSLELPYELVGVEVDHWRPRFWGGKDSIENLELLHGSCNKEKGYWWNGEKDRLRVYRFGPGEERVEVYFAGSGPNLLGKRGQGASYWNERLRSADPVKEVAKATHSGPVGYAWLVRNGSGEVLAKDSDVQENGVDNGACLRGLLEGLRRVESVRGVPVWVVTNNPLVRRVLAGGQLKWWASHGWRSKKGEVIAFAEIWREVAEAANAIRGWVDMGWKGLRVKNILPGERPMGLEVLGMAEEAARAMEVELGGGKRVRETEAEYLARKRAAIAERERLAAEAAERKRVEEAKEAAERKRRAAAERAALREAAEYRRKRSAEKDAEREAERALKERKEEERRAGIRSAVEAKFGPIRTPADARRVIETLQRGKEARGRGAGNLQTKTLGEVVSGG